MTELSIEIAIAVALGGISIAIFFTIAEPLAAASVAPQRHRTLAAAAMQFAIPTQTPPRQQQWPRGRACRPEASEMRPRAAPTDCESSRGRKWIVRKLHASRDLRQHSFGPGLVSG